MIYLWDFLQVLLNDPSDSYSHIIRWQDRFQGIFKIIDPPGLARLWGKRKNLTGMTYDKMSRSLRNYYKTNKLKKVPGQRQVYQFIFSQKNPPLMDPKLGLFIEQSNQIKKNILYQQGLEIIPRNPQMSVSYDSPPRIFGNCSGTFPETVLVKSDIDNTEVKVIELPLKVHIKKENLEQ